MLGTLRLSDICRHACAGQSHDGFFEFARDGRVKHILGTATLIDERGVTLKDGTVLPAHMVTYCGGCEYQGSPPFLKDLNLGDPPSPSAVFLGFLLSTFTTDAVFERLRRVCWLRLRSSTPVEHSS